MADKIYAFDSSATSPLMWTNDEMYTNSDDSTCAVSTCTLFAENCVDALPAAISAYISLSANYKVRVSQTATAGYALTTFCVSCGNGAQTITNTMKVK